MFVSRGDSQQQASKQANKQAGSQPEKKGFNTFSYDILNGQEI